MKSDTLVCPTSHFLENSSFVKKRQPKIIWGDPADNYKFGLKWTLTCRVNHKMSHVKLKDKCWNTGMSTLIRDVLFINRNLQSPATLHTIFYLWHMSDKWCPNQSCDEVPTPKTLSCHIYAWISLATLYFWITLVKWVLECTTGSSIGSTLYSEWFNYRDQQTQDTRDGSCFLSTKGPADSFEHTVACICSL